MPSNPIIRTWLEHIRVLSVEIGPRGSTTEGERRGAEYCRRTFDRLGLQHSVEPFTSARSIFTPHLIGSLLMLAAFAMYPLGGGITAALAALLSLVVLVSELQELGFQNNLFRLVVPKGPSQNVVALIPSSGEHRRDLVLIGHIDTQRTPLIFRTSRLVEAYKAFTTIAFAGFAIQVILFAFGAFTGWSWVWAACIPSALCALLLAAICVEADRSPFTAGANDNASAVGLVLALAEEFAVTPLEHTRVWCACTGCEEVQHYGAIDFFRRHRAEMKDPTGLVFELVGVSGPGWLTTEGIIVPFHSDAGLQRLAEKLAAEHPEWDAYPVKITGGNSELADCARANVPAITLFGLTRTGEAPFWHQESDTFDKIKPSVMGKTYALTRAMIDELDSEI
jgi:hypothetical protein